jgi:menaquinone-dependent protoporphyrinogen IX oxidase
MIRLLIPYGTSEGHTAKIAECLADVIRDQGHEACATMRFDTRSEVVDDPRSSERMLWEGVR